MSYTCKILAIDGGGIRGIIPAYILQQLEAALGKPIYQCFDIIAGTSTGGLIAMALTTPLSSNNDPPLSASAILNLYMTDEDKLFRRQSSGDFWESKYHSIAPWLQSILGSTMTLSRAHHWLKVQGHSIPKQVLATTYTINGASGVPIGPYLFNWVDAINSPADDYYVWEATLGTSSAPTYFPVANVGAGVENGSQATNRWCADGGVVANNPALYALSWAARLGLYTDLSDVLIVSLGTGLYDAGIQIPHEGNWGTIQWLDGTDTKNHSTEPLINVLTMANVMAPAQQLQLIMPQGSYYRLEPVIPYKESTLDGTDTQTLLSTVESYIEPGGSGHANYKKVVKTLRAS
jgi:Patatin